MSGGIGRAVGRGRAGVVGLALITNVAGAAAADLVSDGVLASRVDELNRSAVHQMEAKRFEAGRKHLFEAARLARERGGVQGDALLARTHLHLGALEILAGAQAARATDYFRRALCRDPSVRIPRPLTTHVDVVSAFYLARTEYREPRRCPVAQEPREPEVPASINALDCVFPKEILGGTDVTVRCAANPRRRVDGATLHYDSRDNYTYKAIAMRRTARGWWEATVAGEDVAGRSLAFYVDGTKGGKIVVTSGSFGGRSIVLVVPPDLCTCD